MTYKIEKNQEGKEAIFLDGKQISQWWSKIGEIGLIRGTSDYYKVANNNKWAVFHVKNPKTHASKWWDWIGDENVI